ncbi:acetyltransferase [Brucella endophytica]|uniref:Acetyltransferase n=2 Tax=Brucella endophytica TaxID=1963359 RepID=A0A916WDR3_9HYPH|nr:acetyltransferase [Brucella endophytica]
MPGLATVRQVEAVGFRAWPAANVHYDGTWAIRVTPGFPSRRLNSVNALDPADISDIPARVARASQHLREHGRRPAFRQTPLTPPELINYLDAKGWASGNETSVMIADLSAMNLEGAIDQLPLRDIGRYADASLKIHCREDDLQPGFLQVLGGIKPNRGMFVIEEEGSPLATALCVQDGAMAGIFDVATAEASRRRGHARAIVASAFKWARKNGAKTAWLQVEADNAPGRALYEGFGFREIYRYIYRESPEA